MHHTPNLQQFEALQASRAVAALMVVIFHMGFITEKYFSTAAFMAPAGRAGVEYFFVLSGFIITMAHRQDVGRPEQLFPYLRKRFLRIYPVYWLVFFMAWLPALNIVPLSLPEALRALLLLPATHAPVIIVAWSLQYEVVFYAVFAVFIVNPVAGLLAGLAAWFLLPVLEQGYMFMFLAGVAAALIFQSRRFIPGIPVALAGAALFALAGWQESRSGIPPQVQYAGGAFLIVLGLACAERAGHTVGSQRWLQRLGDASYAIYLVHYPLLSGLYKAAHYFGLSGFWGALLTYAVSLLACMAAGLALNQAIERPLLGKFRAPRHKTVREAA